MTKYPCKPYIVYIFGSWRAICEHHDWDASTSEWDETLLEVVRHQFSKRPHEWDQWSRRGGDWSKFYQRRCTVPGCHTVEIAYNVSTRD